MNVKFTLQIILTFFHDNSIIAPTNFSHQWCEFYYIYFTNSIILLLYFQNILYYSNLIFSTKCNSLTISAPLLSLPGNLDPNTHYNYNNIEEAGNHIDYLPYKIICIKFHLLKLYRSRWLTRQIIKYSIDSFHLIYNSTHYFLKHIIWYLGTVRCHEVYRIYCS